MPELVAIGSVGALITFLLANFNLFIVHKLFSDPQMKILNHNLSKLGWYWSIDQGAPIEVSGVDSDVVRETDYQKATRGAFIFGTMMIFLSWLGLIILVIYMMSVYKLAKSHLEKKMLSSDLVKRDITDLSELKQLLEAIIGSGH